MSGEINAPFGHTITHRLHLSNHARRPIRSSCDAIKDRDYRRMTLIIPAFGPTAGTRHRAQLRAAELAGSRRVSPGQTGTEALHHPMRSALRRRTAWPFLPLAYSHQKLGLQLQRPRCFYRSVPTQSPRGAGGCSGGHPSNLMPDCAHPCRIAGRLRRLPSPTLAKPKDRGADLPMKLIHITDTH